MDCTRVRAALPALVYGDLPADETGEVEKHLSECVECRDRLAALRGVRRALDTVPAPTASVDLPRLYREAAEREARRTRRWRRFAAGLAAAAAVVLFLFALRLEVRVEAHQVVVRWGAPPAILPAPAPAPQPEPPVRIEKEPPAVTAEDLALVKQLIHALATSVEAQDRRQQQSLLLLQERLEAVQGRSQQRLTATERDVAALYVAQFGSFPKGEKP